MTMNNRQKVIKIVGYPAGKLSDSFHLLGLAELVFELLLGSDVAEQAQPQGRGILKLQERAGLLEIDSATVMEGQATFDLFFNHPFPEVVQVLSTDCSKFLGFGQGDRKWPAHQFLARQAHQLAEGLVGGDDDAVLIRE